MNILIANDHGGVKLKNEIKNHLESRGHHITNLGIDTEDSVDYPDLAVKAGTEFKKNKYDFGILICGTGIGISISANKIRGIRCALLINKFSAEMAKAHNNANFIAFGGRINYNDSPSEMVDAFIASKFEGGRHEKRVNKIMDIENSTPCC